MPDIVCGLTDDEGPQVDEEALRNEYAGQRGRLDKLRAEVRSIIAETVEGSGIKISGIEERTKDVESLIDKCRDKNVHRLRDISDAVGLRIICLFRSDIPNLVKVVSDVFSQLSIDDKVNTSVSEFGYMSVHLICQFPKHFSGPRYDDIKGLQFEVQIRTIAMHAWAAISHFIDYKHEAAVPADLRKSLNALSALFYLADTQFETFAREAQQSRRVAEEAINTQATSTELSLNLDTLKAVAGRIFPQRNSDDGNPKWSELLSEISEAGFKSTSDLVNVLTKDTEYPAKYEHHLRKTVKRAPHFTRIGAVRVTLRKYSPEYLRVYSGKFQRSKTGRRPLKLSRRGPSSSH